LPFQAKIGLVLAGLRQEYGRDVWRRPSEYNGRLPYAFTSLDIHAVSRGSRSRQHRHKYQTIRGIHCGANAIFDDAVYRESERQWSETSIGTADSYEAK
jgi:hypothetical protein